MVARGFSDRSNRREVGKTGSFIGLTALLVMLAGICLSTPSAAAANASTTREDGRQANAAQSTSLAGYQATPSGVLTSASVTFTVPATNCTERESDRQADFDVGVFTPITGGSIQLWAGLDTNCGEIGGPYRIAFRAAGLGAYAHFVNAGDVIVASIAQSPSTSKAEIHDLTSGQHWKVSTPSNLGETSAEIGSLDFAASGNPIIPKFPTIGLSDATVHGASLALESPSQYNAVDNEGTTLIKSGPLQTSSSGSSFSLSFKNKS